MTMKLLPLGMMAAYGAMMSLVLALALGSHGRIAKRVRGMVPPPPAS